jgi:hypothetical protein
MPRTLVLAVLFCVPAGLGAWLTWMSVGASEIVAEEFDGGMRSGSMGRVWSAYVSAGLLLLWGWAAQ